MRFRTASLALIAPLALTLAACGSTNGGSAGGTTGSGGNGGPASSSGGSSPSASAPASGSSACATDDLSVKVKPGGAAAGSTYYRIVMTNTGSGACETGGYGGVSLVTAQGGSVIGAPAQRDSTHKARPMTLKPGGKAVAVLQVVQAANFPKAKCQPTKAAGLQVFPPNQTKAAFVPLHLTGCAKSTVQLLTLRPYHAKA